MSDDIPGELLQALHSPESGAEECLSDAYMEGKRQVSSEKSSWDRSFGRKWFLLNS